MARAPKRRGDALVEHPAHREINHPLAVALLREAIEPLNRSKILSKPRGSEFGVGAAQIVAFKTQYRPSFVLTAARGRARHSRRSGCCSSDDEESVRLDGLLE